MKAMAHEIGDRYVSATRMLSDMDEFRKNPSLLFDYNTPTDDVIKMPPPLVLNDQKGNQTPEPEPKKDPEPIPFTKLENRSRNRVTDAERAAKPKTTATREKQRQKKQQVAGSSSRAATIAIIVCAVVALIAIGILLYFILTEPEEELVRVPNLLEQEYTEGMTVEGLKIKVSWDNHEEIPEGHIFYQKPEPGEGVVKGTTLYITVSQGKTPEETGTIIDYAMETPERTRELLEKMHLELNILDGENYAVHDKNIPAGKVVKTEPEAGSTLTKGQTVIIYVSKGPGDGEMPDVVEKIREQAIKELNDKKLDLVIKEEEINDSEIPAGFVVKTEPVSETQIIAGQTVKIYISKGPKLAEVPNVVGKSFALAQQELTNAGFTSIGSNGNTASGTVVIAQSNDAGTQLDVNKTITLTMGIKKPVTFTWTPEDPAKSSRLKITRDGAVLVDIDVEAGVTQYVLEDQLGNGEVTYMVSIDGKEPWPETVRF